MRTPLLVACLAACLSLCITGCGKIPTWGELTGGQPAVQPAPAAQPVVVQPVAPVQQVVVPAKPNAAEVVGRFQALRSGEINDTELTKLLTLDEGLEQVTQIDATGSQLSSKAFGSIQKLTNLQQLRLTGTKVDNEACEKIAELPSLEVLSLTDTLVTDVGVARLSGLPNLKVLELVRCRLEENAFNAIGQFPSLKDVNVESTNMNFRDLDLLCNAKTITRLRLLRNPINDEALVALKKLQDLEELELGATQCQGWGLGNATKGGGLKHLKFLSMYACPMNAQGAKAVSAIKSLEKISLGAIGIMSDADFASIVQGMKNLKHVYIAQCTNMDGSGLAALKGCKDLEELHINQCDKMGDGVVKIVKGFKNLKVLTCSGTAITPKGIAEIKSALPDCKVQ